MSKDVPAKSPLEKIRKESGVSQQELADEIGVSQAQIQRYEAGIRRISPKRAKQMAKMLECHWMDLMDQASLDAVEQINDYNARELALVELFRGLSETDQDAVFRHAAAVSEQSPAVKTKRRVTPSGGD